MWHLSPQGLGTDDHTLIRVMVTRCEVDLIQIKNKFLRTYGKTLGSFIKVSQGVITTNTPVERFATRTKVLGKIYLDCLDLILILAVYWYKKHSSLP